MQIFENIPAILAYLSIGVLFVCAIISLILSMDTFGMGKFYESFKDFYKQVRIFFCLPVYGLSFISEGISEKMNNRNPIFSFVMALFFFLIVVISINIKKIKKGIERRKKKWRF